MGKYSTYTRADPKPNKNAVHPVMRGIGCILIVVIPILAYGLSILLVNYGAQNGWPIPKSWFGPPTIHPLLWKIQGLNSILLFLQGQNNLEANLAFTVIITVVLAGLMSMIYGYIYTIFGPPKYGPHDAPPPRGRKPKPYKR